MRVSSFITLVAVLVAVLLSGHAAPVHGDGADGWRGPCVAPGQPAPPRPQPQPPAVGAQPGPVINWRDDVPQDVASSLADRERGVMTVRAFVEIDEAMTTGKLVVVYVARKGCEACREFETVHLADAGLAQHLAACETIRVNADDFDIDRSLRHRYRLSGKAPRLAVYAPDGKHMFSVSSATGPSAIARLMQKARNYLAEKFPR